MQLILVQILVSYGIDLQNLHPTAGFISSLDLTGALHVLQLQFSPLTTSFTLSSSNIQNGDILVLADPGPPGKMADKCRETWT